MNIFVHSKPLWVADLICMKRHCHHGQLPPACPALQLRPALAELRSLHLLHPRGAHLHVAQGLAQRKDVQQRLREGTRAHAQLIVSTAPRHSTSEAATYAMHPSLALRCQTLLQRIGCSTHACMCCTAPSCPSRRAPAAPACLPALCCQTHPTHMCISELHVATLAWQGNTRAGCTSSLHGADTMKYVHHTAALWCS